MSVSDSTIQDKPAVSHKSPVVWNLGAAVTVRRNPDNPDGPLRVLLAEDNPLDQLGIRRLLEKRGFEVALASDGRKAVDMFVKGSFELVLLDILMPEMDGFEVATRIRMLERSAGQHVPVFALTAYSLNAVYDKCRNVGMNGYLSKPVAAADIDTLCEILAINNFGTQLGQG